MRRALVVVGKAPRPGAAKTRLSPPLSAEGAARLYAGFLQDTLGMACRLGWERVSLIYPPEPNAESALRALVPPEVSLQPQSGHGLGPALAGAFEQHLAEGFREVVLIGSDNPTLPPALVESARRALADYDLALGPSADGGYYLLAMRCPHLGIFERITWSTDVVFAQTRARARALGLSVHALPEWYDVDTATDLARLRHELAHLRPEVAPATRAVLADLRL